MHKTASLLVACILLSACYFVRQSKFEESVHSWIRVGMPFSTAISILGNKGMDCTGEYPASCARIRGGLQPYSCMERVNVTFDQPHMLVSDIQIPKIHCAGL